MSSLLINVRESSQIYDKSLEKANKKVEKSS